MSQLLWNFYKTEKSDDKDDDDDVCVICIHAFTHIHAHAASIHPSIHPASQPASQPARQAGRQAGRHACMDAWMHISRYIHIYTCIHVYGNLYLCTDFFYLFMLVDNYCNHDHQRLLLAQLRLQQQQRLAPLLLRMLVFDRVVRPLHCVHNVVYGAPEPCHLRSFRQSQASRVLVSECRLCVTR